MRMILIGITVAVAAVGAGAWRVGGAWPAEAEDRPEAPQQIESDVIENLFRLGQGLYSGGDPQGDPGFEQLRRLGVRTIISVDGAAPDVETARRHGMRYVHLPIGYDSIPHDQAVRIIAALRTLPGPVFVHCHHGKHRGPSAAALCGMVAEGWSHDDARRWLETAGTAPDYAGLYRSVATFAPPTPQEMASAGELPERAEVSGLVDAMVDVDARWEGLKAIRAAGFRTPDDRPDLDPPHEALQLLELFRESSRLPESADRGQAFLDALTAAESAASDLRSTLVERGASPTGDRGTPRAEAAFRAVERSCASCHARYRN